MLYLYKILITLYLLKLSISQLFYDRNEQNSTQLIGFNSTYQPSQKMRLNQNQKNYSFVYNHNIVNTDSDDEDLSQSLLSSKIKKINYEAPICTAQTTPVKQIICNDISCTANNIQNVEVDISTFETFSLCLTSPNSIIDLTNINFKMGEVNQQIILQANTIKLKSFQIEVLKDTNVNLQIISYNQIVFELVNFSKFQSTVMKSEGVLKLNNSQIDSQEQSYITNGNFVGENTKFIIQNSIDLKSKNDIWLKKFSINILNQPNTKSKQKNTLSQQVDLISSQGNIFILDQSEFQLLKNPVYLQAIQVNISQSNIITQSILTINTINIIKLQNSKLNSSFAYIYNQNSDDKSIQQSISIVGTTITSDMRLCKTSCIDKKDQLVNLLPKSQQNKFELNGQCQMIQYSPLVSLLSDSVNNQFMLDNTKKRYNLKTYDDLINLLKTNYTAIVITMGKIEINSKSDIIASNLGIYAANINLSYDSKLSAHSKGCLGTKGAGGGIVDILMRLNLQCGGPGGSYGSLGGSPISEKAEYNQLCSQISSQTIYGNKNDPIYEGSGGGGYVLPPLTADIKNNDEHLQYTEQSAGAGGGFIYIETFYLSLYGEVDVSGGKPEPDFSYLGSGSGGSIQIHTGIMIGNGTIKANGGERNLQGGEGGAGRIKINMTNWATISQESIEEMSIQNNVIVEVRQGSSDKKNKQVIIQTDIFNDATESHIDMLGFQNGSFISTPCMPGYQPKNNLFICEKCPIGYYKSSYNLEQCRPCLNADNDRLNFSISEILQTNASCLYRCKNSYQSKYVNSIKTCVTNGELFVDSLGGSNVIFFVILLIVSILLNLIILCITKRMNKKKKIQKSIRFSKQVDKNKVRFTLEDLPFHQQRFYIEGENTLSKPWVVNEQIKSEIVKILLQGYKSIDQSDLDQLGILKGNNLGIQRSSGSGYHQFEGNYSYNYSYEMDLSNENQFNASSNHGAANDGTAQHHNSYNIWDEIRKACEYTKWEKFVLTLLKFIYPFGYYTQGATYKQQKWKRMKKVMQQFLLDLKAKNCSIGIKFSCSSCYCQAYFDIVDYNKTELQWDIEAKMPICLLLQGKGSFMSPFYLNSRDPMFSLLVTFIKSKCDLNYFNYGEIDSRKLSNIDKSMNIFHTLSIDDQREGLLNRNQDITPSEEFDLTEVNDIISKRRELSMAASSIIQSRTQSREKTLPKRKVSNSRFSSVEMQSNNPIQGEQKQTEPDEQCYEDEEEDISYQLISLVECFFNKLNTYSRTICYQLKFDEFRRRFLRFMNFISDNQDIFELFSLYIQVNIHKIKIEKPSEDYDPSKIKRISIHSFQGVEEECSSVTILPQNIVPGSIAEKQLELLLQKTHERKKEYNDFEYKISLIFSKEKIYEFDKQYVQRMPTINKQLEWVCQPKKNQVKILIQHAEQENQIHNLYDLQDRDNNNNDENQVKNKVSSDSIYEIYELKGLNDDFVVVDQVSPPKKDRPSRAIQASYHSKQDHSSAPGRSVTGSQVQSDTSKHNDLTFFPQQSVKEDVEEENNEDKDNNLEEYQHIGDSRIEGHSNNKSKSFLKKLKTKIRQYFSLIKAYILSYRIINNKLLNSSFVLRFILVILIGIKLVFFWLIHIQPFEEIIIGESNTYDNVLIAIQTSIYPFAAIISVFYQIIWILKQDISSGKKCMILSTMEIISSLIIMPLSIPQIILDQYHWRQFLYNLLYFSSNIFQGFIGSIYLLKNQEKSIQFCDD